MDHQQLVDLLTSSGLRYAETIVTECELSGVPVAFAAGIAVAEANRNIYGHDLDACMSTGPGGPDIEVTEQNYAEYRACVRAGGKRNGVGPFQLTYATFQDTADGLGGCWRPEISIRVAIAHIKNLLTSRATAAEAEQRGKTVEWVAARRYNGGGAPTNASDAYANRAVRLVEDWRTVMALPLSGAASVLRAAGLTVREYAGWQTRTQTDGPFLPRALMWHHDASPVGDSPGVPGQLANLANNGAQFWVDRAGTWWCIAAGRMWHAGAGGGCGVIPAGGGNTYSAGVETDHTTGEAWPTAQLDSLRRGSAALCKAYGWQPLEALWGHKEYTTRKPDPDGLNMTTERQAVARLMTGDTDVVTDDDVRRIATATAAAILQALIAFRPPLGGAERNLWDGLDESLRSGSRVETALDAIDDELDVRPPITLTDADRTALLADLEPAVEHALRGVLLDAATPDPE